MIGYVLKQVPNLFLMAYLLEKQQRKLVLFSGPRHSGKDTAANRCRESFGAHLFKMSAPNKAAIRAIFELEDVDVDYLESVKTLNDDVLFGTSYVRAQISFSEDWMKPFLGVDIFGRLAARRLRKVIDASPTQGLFCCSDSGFVEEAFPVMELFGKKNTLLVKLAREGKTFEGDSRSYIDLPGVATCWLQNDDKDSYLQAVDDLVGSFLAGEPCPF